MNKPEWRVIAYQLVSGTVGDREYIMERDALDIDINNDSMDQANIDEMIFAEFAENQILAVEAHEADAILRSVTGIKTSPPILYEDYKKSGYDFSSTPTRDVDPELSPSLTRFDPMQTIDADRKVARLEGWDLS
jgi:hypothetical protein